MTVEPISPSQLDRVRFDRARFDLGRFDPRLIALNRIELGRIDPYWQRSRLWWVERSVREQVLLAALCVAGIVAALLLLVIAPLRIVRADALAQIRVAALLEARLRAGGTDTGQNGGAPAGRMRRGTASAIITDSVSAARLTIARIEPEGADTRVVIGDAPFEQILQWIADMEATSRLRVSQATIERKATGVVATTVVITG